MNSYKVQEKISRRLLGWAIPDILLGVVIILSSWNLLYEIGLHAIIWGIIDATIALAGMWISRRKIRGSDAGTLDIADTKKHLRGLFSILRFNAFLDIGYLLIGGALVLGPGTRGHGIGIIIQALFLLIFDTFYSIQTRKLLHESSNT